MLQGKISCLLILFYHNFVEEHDRIYSTWSCELCTFLNQPYSETQRDICDMCEGPSPLKRGKYKFSYSNYLIEFFYFSDLDQMIVINIYIYTFFLFCIFPNF